jgi:NADH-quinone oxidoreductase subunit L
MPITCWTFACGAAALAGVPGLSGFWSKDAILAELAYAGAGGFQIALYRILLVSALVTAFLTAFYSFRAFFKTFWGEEKIPAESGEHAHESPPIMTWPLIVLSIFAVAVGGIVAQGFHGFNVFLARTPGLAAPHPSHSTLIMMTSSLVALAGVGLAWAMYSGPSRLPNILVQQFGVLYELSRDKFRLDEAYHALVVQPTLMLAEVSRVVDEWVIDGVVRLIGSVPALFGRLVLRPIQNGVMQYYALGMVFGLVVLVLAMAGWLKF